MIGAGAIASQSDDVAAGPYAISFNDSSVPNTGEGAEVIDPASAGEFTSTNGRSYLQWVYIPTALTANGYKSVAGWSGVLTGDIDGLLKFGVRRNGATSNEMRIDLTSRDIQDNVDGIVGNTALSAGQWYLLSWHAVSSNWYMRVNGNWQTISEWAGPRSHDGKWAGDIFQDLKTGEVAKFEMVKGGVADMILGPATSWNVNLTLAEITEIVNGGYDWDPTTHTTRAANLVHHYKMGAGDSGTTLIDSAGNDDLTMINSSIAANRISKP